MGGTLGRHLAGVVVGIVVAVLAAAVVAAADAGAATQTRYSLVHGCYAVSAQSRALPGAGRVRMQATALGRYLLYTSDRRFVAARAGGGVGLDSTPGPAADWRVEAAGNGQFTLTPTGGGAPLRGVGFHPASGCAEYPEAELDATGTPSQGATSYGKVGGLLEGHMHWMTYQFLGGRFHCGKPWDAYGIPYALPNCSAIEGPRGLVAPMQNFLNYGNPVQPHDTTGWPTLASWTPTNLTYEGTYWRWIQRAWMAGLRMMVMSPNENRILCLLQPNRDTDCDEMATVRNSLQAIHQLQDYVDAQSGGPGKGFFEIVTDPEQARRVINQGRMAVVLEVEVSEPFGCSGTDGHSTCDQAQVDAGLDELHRLGVRSMLCSTSSTTRSPACASTAAPSACSSTPATSSAPGRSGARRRAPPRCTTTTSTRRRHPSPASSGSCSARPACRAGSRPSIPRRPTATRAGSRRWASTSSSG